MKKCISLFILVLLLTFSTAAVAEAAGDITVLVNNNKVTFPDQKPYIDKNNRTLVPVRFVSTALGAKVNWNGETRVVTISKKDRTITLKIGESKAAVNGQTRYFDTKAVITGSRTMVPLRFISECLGATVQWIAKTKTVKITVNNGYTIPENPNVVIEMPAPENNPNKVDISLIIKLGKELEPQFNDVYNIVKSKFGLNFAQEITDYIRQKNDRWAEVPIKTWYINNQRIEVSSASGSYIFNIIIWQPGVK